MYAPTQQRIPGIIPWLLWQSGQNSCNAELATPQHMSDLPLDIVTEIIVRAYDPVNKLRRFSCVSKSISAFLGSDLAWQKVIEIFYPWALSTELPKEVSYKHLLEFIQPSAVDGLLILVKTDKDSVKYGEQITLTTTLKNVSTKSLTLLSGTTNRGISFQNGTDLEFYREPNPLAKKGKGTDLRRLCGTGAKNILETIPSGQECTYEAKAILTSPDPTQSCDDKLMKDKIPTTAQEVRLSFGRRDKLYLDPNTIHIATWPHDTEERPNKRRKIELPEKFTIYIRYEYDMTYLRRPDVHMYRPDPTGAWNNTTYSNLVPIHIDLSDRV